MENFNNIDQLFNEESKKSEEHTDFPGFENVWEKVEARLDKAENKKRIIPIWLPYSIAASLAITIGLVYFLNQKSELPNTSITSNNDIENSVNQNITNALDSSKIASIDETVKNNIQKLEINNIENSSARNASPKVISNVESIKPVQIQNANYFEANSDKEKENLVLADAENLKKEDSNPVLASGFVQNQEVVKTYAIKEARAEFKNPQRAIPEESHVTLAESTDVSGISDDDFSDVKIAMNKNSQPLYIVDGYVADAQFIKKYNVKKITSLNIVEGKNAVELYGNSGKKGVVVITTKGLSNKEKQELKVLSTENK